MRSRSLRRTCWASRRWGCAGQPLKTIAEGEIRRGRGHRSAAVRRVSRGARRQVGARRDEDGVRARTLCRVGSRPCRPKARPLPTVAGHGRAPAHRIPRGDHVTLTGGKSDRPRFREEISCLFQDSRPRAPKATTVRGAVAHSRPRPRARPPAFAMGIKLRVRVAGVDGAQKLEVPEVCTLAQLRRAVASKLLDDAWAPEEGSVSSIASTTSARAGRASPPRSARAA